MNTDLSTGLCLEPLQTIKSNGISENGTKNDGEEYSEFSNNCTSTKCIKDTDKNVDSCKILDNLEPDQFQFDDIRIPSNEGYSEDATSELNEMSLIDKLIQREDDTVSVQNTSQLSLNSNGEAPVIEINIDRTTIQSDKGSVENEILSLAAQPNRSNMDQVTSMAHNSEPNVIDSESINYERQEKDIPLENHVPTLSLSTSDISTCNNFTENSSETISLVENEAEHNQLNSINHIFKICVANER